MTKQNEALNKAAKEFPPKTDKPFNSDYIAEWAYTNQDAIRAALSDGGDVDCHECGGCGWYIAAVADENGEPIPNQEPCDTCLGTGSLTPPEQEKEPAQGDDVEHAFKVLSESADTAFPVASTEEIDNAITVLRQALTQQPTHKQQVELPINYMCQEDVEALKTDILIKFEHYFKRDNRRCNPDKGAPTKEGLERGKLVCEIIDHLTANGFKIVKG